MPAKQVVCSTCGQTVLKSQTYHIGDGKRACRSHPGVPEIAEARKTSDRMRIENQASSSRSFGLPDLDPLVCYRCGKQGILARDFFLKILKESKRIELETGRPFLHMFAPPEERQKLADRFIGREKVCLTPINARKIKNRIFILHRFAALVDFSDYVQLCPDCIKACRLEKEATPDLSEIQLKNLFLLGAVVDKELTRQVESEKLGA